MSKHRAETISKRALARESHAKLMTMKCVCRVCVYFGAHRDLVLAFKDTRETVDLSYLLGMRDV